MERTIAARIRQPFRIVLAALALTLVVSVAISAYLLQVAQPRIEEANRHARLVRLSHQAALDEQTALRAYLATGDSTFLRDAHAADERRREHNVELDGTGVAGVLPFRVAQETWQQAWAEQAFAVDPAGLDAGHLKALLKEDKLLFDRYGDLQLTTIEDLIAARDGRQDDQRLGTEIAGSVAVALLFGALVLAAVHRERLLRDVRGPLDDMLATVRRIGAGDLAARPAGGGPVELQRLAEGLGVMAATLAEQDRWAFDRTVELATTANRLQTILDLARKITGSTSVAYVAEAAAEATLRVSDAHDAQVFLLDEGSGTTLQLAHDSRRTGEAPLPVETAPAGVAAKDARKVTALDGGRRTLALPLVVGGRVTGVLQVRLDEAPADDTVLDDLLETLAAHTAAAIEAARLHGQAEALSKVDALTKLANRRRLDEDLESECARSARYQRPLGLVMLDLDHFKSLNDRFGHQHGDEVLERVAQVLAEEVRSTDTVYRYGGEELAILARESTLDDTAGMAERLRRAVAADPFVNARARVTASFGVAAVPDHAAAPEVLVAAADRALYEAKRQGRDRVVTAQAPEAARTSAPEARALQSAT